MLLHVKEMQTFLKNSICDLQVLTAVKIVDNYRIVPDELVLDKSTNSQMQDITGYSRFSLHFLRIHLRVSHAQNQSSLALSFCKKKKHDSTNVGHCRQRVKKVSAVCIKLSF